VTIDIFSWIAATCIGAIPCGIYPTSSPEVAYVMRLLDARIFVDQGTSIVCSRRKRPKIAARRQDHHLCESARPL
jgi:hypothetical protein